MLQKMSIGLKLMTLGSSLTPTELPSYRATELRKYHGCPLTEMPGKQGVDQALIPLVHHYVL